MNRQHEEVQELLATIHHYLQHANENLQKNNVKCAAHQVHHVRCSLEKIQIFVKQP